MEKQIEIKEITPKIANEKLLEGSLLVDVRESEEIEQIAYKVSEIVVIPLSEFENRFAELPKDRELIIACRRGRRSLIAAEFLVNQGYEKVSNLSGGILLWQAEGFLVDINK